MTQTHQSAPPDVRVEVQKVASMVTTARRLLAGGTMVDLSALQGMVSGVCSRVGALPRDEGRQMRGGLESLLRSLDSLQDDVEALHAKVTGGAPR